MSRSIALADRLQEVLLDGHWIANTNYQDQLRHVGWQQATQAVGGLNTIAALTHHLTYYLKGLLSAFATGRLDIRDQYSFDLPPLRSEADWQALVAELLYHAAAFVAWLRQADDQLLDQPFVYEKYGSYLRNVEGVIEHSYYHLGQLVLLRKLLAPGSPAGANAAASPASQTC